MELKQLRYFTAVADAGSISAAAKKLYISQPPLSVQIRHLEEELGCVLFERGARQIILTEAGRKLYAHAQKILEMSQIAAKDVQPGSSDILRIGIVSSVVSSPGTDWIAGYARKNPTVSFAITEANTYRLLEDLRAHLIQIAILRTPCNAEDMEKIPLVSEYLTATGKADFLKSEKKTLTPADLSEVPLILYRRWQLVVEDMFSRAECTMRTRILCDDARTAYTLAKEGIGVAILPASGTQSAANDGLCVRKLDSRDALSQIMIVWLYGQKLSARTQSLVQYLQNRCGLPDEVPAIFSSP